MSAPHTSVLLDEVIAALEPASGKLIIDGTFGAGGYSRGFLATGADVVAFDRDPSARKFAEGLGERFRLVDGRFSQMAEELGEGVADGVALDLGVSSMQLDQAERGFSFMRDGPLDMRMGADGPTAADIVNTAEQAELARIFFVYGEERQSRRVASFIVRRRAEQPFTRTLDLAEVIERALGGRRGAKVHAATRSFQGLRIAVNEELAELEAGLVAVVLSVYLAKTMAGRERAEIASIEKQIDAEKARIRLLQAEVAHLEQPARIESLSTAHLGMAPLQAKHETTIDKLSEIAIGKQKP